jgi:hypothetical protein
MTDHTPEAPNRPEPPDRTRAALDLLDVIDGIVDDTHPEGDGCPLCAALDDLRDTLEAAAQRDGAGAPPDGTRLILASEAFLEDIGTRTADGRRITAEWGEPDANGWYSPTFTAHDDAGATPGRDTALDDLRDAATVVLSDLYVLIDNPPHHPIRSANDDAARLRAALDRLADQ